MCFCSLWLSVLYPMGVRSCGSWLSPLTYFAQHAPQRSVHALARGSAWSPPAAEQCPTVRTSPASLSNRPSKDTGRLHVLTTMNTAPMNTGVRLSLQIGAFLIFLVESHRRDCPPFSSSRGLRTVSRSGCSSLRAHPRPRRAPASPQPRQHLFLVRGKKKNF